MDGGEEGFVDHSSYSHRQMDSEQTTKLIASNDDETKEGCSETKGKEEKIDSINRIEPSSHHRYFQRGISISDNAISSHQLSSNFIVRKLSGVLSTLLEIGERGPSSRGSSVLITRSRIPYAPAPFETPIMRRAQSVKASSSAKRATSSREGEECDDGGDTSVGFGDEPECSCGACSKWKQQPILLVSSEENTMAEKCDPDWVQCGYYSDLGALCEICAGRPLLHGTCCRHNEQASTLGSFDTLCSFAANCSNMSRETSSERLCRICHCSSLPDDPLISPCRCSGTLKFVHMSCLLHWLTICSRKLRRPPVCELCLYKYRRRRIFKWRDAHLPSIPRRDLGYLTVFIVAVALMFLSAAMSFVCFYIERKFGIVGNNKPASVSPEAREWESILSSATLASAIIFFLGLFVAMYAHVKTEVSLARYAVQCWRSNHEWIIEEYRASRDERYSFKLEQLRRKINGEDEGSRVADVEETLPLRTTVLE